ECVEEKREESCRTQDQKLEWPPAKRDNGPRRRATAKPSPARASLRSREKPVDFQATPLGESSSTLLSPRNAITHWTNYRNAHRSKQLAIDLVSLIVQD